MTAPLLLFNSKALLNYDTLITEIQLFHHLEKPSLDFEVQNAFRWFLFLSCLYINKLN